MRSIIAGHRSDYACYVRIDGEEHFLSKKDVEQKFVRTQPFGDDWSHTAADLSAEKIRSQALKLTAYNDDGSMEFLSRKLDEHKLSKDWNDGNWIAVEKCVQLFLDNSLKIQRVYIPMDDSPYPFSIKARL